MKLGKMIKCFALSLFCFVTIVKADVIKFVDCEYSEEYLKWTKLSEEDKKVFKEPSMCKENKIPSIKGVDTLPRKYNLLDEEKILREVRDQKKSNSCWAFASTEAISSNALFKGINATYSPAHMELLTQDSYPVQGLKTFNREASQGGNYFISSAYVMNHLGPVLESSMPFVESSEENDYLNYLKSHSKTVTLTKPGIDVNKVVLKNNDHGACSQEAIDFIKKYIIDNGAMAAQLYFSLDGTHLTRSLVSSNTYQISNDYINKAYYYYDGEEIPNHGVSIVGFDDSVSKESFSTYHKPSKNGAWIVKNSYGASYKVVEDSEEIEYLQGNRGYYYVSYEDTNICTSLAGFYDVDIDVSDYTYSYDYLGWNGVLTTDSRVVYLANKFKKQSSDIEKIDKIAFGSAQSGQKYEVYYSSTGSLNRFAKIGEGVTKERGYESFVFPGEVVVGDEFGIIIKFISDSSDISLVGAGSTNVSSSHYYNYDIKDDVSYISKDGANWTLMGVGDTRIQNSIKAYTSKLDSVPATPTVINEETTTPTTGEPTIEIAPNNSNDEPIPDYVENKKEESKDLPKAKGEDEEEIENPNTGASLSLGLVFIVLCISGYILHQTKKKQKLFKM